MLGPEGFATCDACVGQRLEELEVAIEELLDRSPAQPLASAKAGDQLEHVCLAQWEVEREGPGDKRRWVGGWIIDLHPPLPYSKRIHPPSSIWA